MFLRKNNLNREQILADSVEEILLRVDKKLCFKDYISKSFRTLFASEANSTHSFVDLFITNSNFSPKIKAEVIEKLTRSFGKTEQEFEQIRAYLPNIFHLTIHGFAFKLTAEYRPIIESERIRELLIVMRIIEPSASQHRFDSRYYDQIYRVFKLVKERHHDFVNFVTSTNDFIKDCTTALRSSDTLRDEDIERVFSNLNLIKVSAKFIGFDHITHIISDIEKLLGNARFDVSRLYFFQEMIKHVELLQEVISSYFKLSTLLETKMTSERTTHKRDFHAVLAARSFFKVSRIYMQEKMNEDVLRVDDYFEALFSTPLDMLVGEMGDDFVILAKRHSKKAPRVTLIKNDLHIAQDLSETLKKILTQLVTHSIVDSEPVTDAGEGQEIFIEGKKEDSRIVIDYYDTNKGFDSTLLAGYELPGKFASDRERREALLRWYFLEARVANKGEIDAALAGLRSVPSLLDSVKGAVSFVYVGANEQYWRYRVRILLPPVKYLMLQNRNLLEDISVVVIDNDIKTVHMLKQHFLHLGVRTKVFANESSGYKYLSEQGADLLISDFTGDPKETLSFLRRLKSNKCMPFLYLLVTNSDADQATSLLAGYVSAVFKKPLEPRLLSDYVLDVIYKKKT